MAISVTVISNKTITLNQALVQGKGGKAVHIEAIKGGQYLLAANGKERSPENITVKRVGNNLHVALEGSDPERPELIIENFFSNQGQLVGIAEDGIYYEYVATDGDQDAGAAFLMDDVSSPLALGKQPLAGFADGLVVAEKDGFGMLPWLLGGLAIAGGAAAAGGGGGGKGNDGGSGKVVDTTPPINNGIATVTDDQGRVRGDINNGDVTDDNRPSFAGKGQDPGDKVIINDNGRPIGEAIVDGNGNWTFTPDVDLADGEHVIEVVVTDPAGNSSGPSDDFVVIIDTTPPLNKGIDDVQDDQGAVTGTVGNGGTTDDGRPMLSGKGDAGDTVTILDNGKVIGEVPVDDDGRWSFVPDVALMDGEHVFEVIVTDPAGNSSGPSDDYRVIIDTEPLFKPTIDSVIDNEGELRGALSFGDVTDDSRPEISGTGKPGTIVAVHDNGAEIGRAEVDSDGRWTFRPALPLVLGGHELTVETVDALGKASNPSDVFALVIGSQDAPAVPAITAVVDDVGIITGSIQKHGITDDARPTISGTAQAGMIVAIYIDGKLAGNTQVNAHGEWTFTPLLDLPDGLHNIAATAKNALGVVSPKTGEYPIVVDTVPPLKPGQDEATLLDDQAPKTGAIVNGTITDDNTPTFNGTAEPNSRVFIYDGEQRIGEVATDAAGNWSFTPSPALKDGAHAFSYVVADVAGNIGPRSDSIVFEVDTSLVVISIEGADDAVGVNTGPISKGGVTDDASPSLHGKATAGGIVRIYEGSLLLGQTLADKEGNWVVRLEQPLSEGEHRLEATVTTAAAGESGRSTIFDFTVDATAPQVPTIDVVTDDVGYPQGPLRGGDSTDDTTPTLSGRAEAGTTVHIYGNGLLLGSVPADINGNWSFTPSPPLLNGGHEFVVTSQDRAGNASAASEPFALIVDTLPPSKPTIELVYDDQGSQTGYLASGDFTDDAKPLLSGTAEANGTVLIMDHGNVIGRVAADADGNWRFEPSLPLLEGEHQFTVKAVDAAGNISVPSGSFIVVVGNPDRPSMPAITSVIDDVGTITGNIQKNSVTDDARPTIHGTAQAGMLVSVYIDGVLAGTTRASATGEWSFTPESDLSEGLHGISATAANSLGNISPATGIYPIHVDTVAPSLADAALWDDAGNVTGQIANGDITDDSTPTFVGKSEPNATVVIYDDGEEIGRVQSGADGDWNFTPTEPLLDGAHGLSHAVIDQAGNRGPVSDVINFVVDTSRIEISLDGAIDDKGLATGAIAMGGVSDDTTPTLHGRATAGGTVTVYDGGVVLGTTVAGSDGRWSLTPETPLSEGPHALTATVTTVATGQSTHSAVFDFVVDLTAPDKPTIEQVWDDVGLPQDALVQGQSTDDTTPTLSGKAEPGSTVHIHDGGSLLGKVLTDAAGNWSFTPSPPLLNGLHDFTVVAEDKAGNMSAPSDAFAIVIDTVPPAAPVINTVHVDQGDRHGFLLSGDATDDAKPTVSGSAEPGSTIIILDAGNKIGEVVADENGNWVFEPVPPLDLGEHVLSAVAQDAAGNVSLPSADFDLVVASPLLPDRPLIIEVVDAVGAVLGPVARDGVTDDPRPLIVGTAQPDVTISVYANGILLGTAVADGQGEWSFIPDNALADGVHAITAKASNALGNVSMESDDYSIRVDTVPPSKPGEQDAQLLDDVGHITGQIVNGTVTDDSTPTFAGTTEADAIVIVFDKGSEIGRVIADGQGHWKFTPDTPLQDGEHVFNYRVVDQAGNASQVSDEIVFTVDTAPVGVTLEGALDDAGAITGEIISGGVTDDSTPTLYGSANPGGLVQVYEGSVLLGQAIAAADGSWRFTPAQPLSEGPHRLHATVITAAHGESSASDVFDLTIDVTPPGVPSIESVMDDVGSVLGQVLSGQYTDDTMPTLLGKADAGSVVNLYDNGVLLGSAVAGADGLWTFTPAVPLADGAHVFSAVSVDAAGNQSAPSSPYTVLVDVLPPGRPTIDSVVDDQGDMTGTLTTGASTDDAKPVLSGKAEAHATIIVKDQGLEIGRVQTDASGRWSYVPDLPLAQGVHTFTTTAIDLAGNVGPASNAFQLTVLTDARPLSPAILGVMDDMGAITGIIQKNGATDDVRPTVFGTAQAGSIVSVYVDDVLLGTTQADGKGSWTFSSSVDFPDGLHYFTVIANSGGVVSATTGKYPVLFDSTPPAAPTATDASLWDLVGESISVITNGSVTDDKTPAFVGKAEANATIIIYDGGIEIGRTVTNASGNWMFSPMPALVDGAHQLAYAVMDKAGNLSARSADISFVVETSALLVVIEGADDDVGSRLGAITDGGTTDDTRPSFHGKAVPGGIVTLYDGVLVLGQTTAAADGSWRFSVETPLATGLHNVYAKVFTEAAGQSAASPTFYLVIDTSAPAKPSIEQIVDDVGARQGSLADAQSTDDGTPTLTGRAEAGGVVRIYDNGSLLGSVVADASGVWSFTPTTLLNNGKHQFTVTCVDEAGNVSPASDAYTILVDTVAPSAPTIDSVQDDQGAMIGTLASGATTDDAKPVLGGKAEADAIIIVKDNGVEIGRTRADGNGRWSFEPSLPLAQGAHSFAVEALDAAGNISASSKSFGLQVFIDNPPEVAAITSVLDDVGTVTGTIQKNAVTNDPRPTITGTAPLGMTVSVYIDDILVGTTMADGRGYWSFTPGNALSDGVHHITAIAADGSGGVTSMTGSYSIVVDTVAPVAPAAGSAALWSDVGQINAQIGEGGQTEDASPTYKGRASPDAIIVIYDKGMEIGRAATDNVGNWSFTPYPALNDGQHRFTYEVMDAAGNISAPSDELVFVVATAALAISIDGVDDNAGVKSGGVATGAVIDDVTPTLFGKAIAGVVKIYEGSVLLGLAETAIDGTWRFTPTLGLTEGTHNLHATVTPAGGKESSASAFFSVVVDTSAPGIPTIDSVSNDVGKIQGLLIDGKTADDSTPTLAGKAEAGSTVFIYGNGSLLGSVPVAGDGAWSFTPTTPLINGPHVLTVTSMDKAGNISAPSAPHTVIVDTIAPDKPTIDTADDDQGAMLGTLVSGDDTDDRQPVLNGKAEAGSTVVIRDNGVEIGIVIADQNGLWSHAIVEPLSLGLHVFTLTAVDLAGNTSVASDGFELTVVLDASVDPLILAAAGPDQEDAAVSVMPVMKTGEVMDLWSMLSLPIAPLLPEQGASELLSRSVVDRSVGDVLQANEGIDLVPSWMAAEAMPSAEVFHDAGIHSAYVGLARADDLMTLYAI